jgi:hypothetical protein
MTQKEAIAKAPERRVRRQVLGRRNVLTVSGKEPGYVYRFVNDMGDRVALMEQSGYEIVNSKGITIGDSRLSTPSNQGSAVVASVGLGDKAVLMRIREDWYAEDQAAKAAHVKATEDATREKALDGNYGKLDISRS